MLSVTGIAVQTGDGGYVANDGRQMVDVTDFVINGSQDYVYRVPTTRLYPGDLVVTSDSPLATLFVQDIREDGRIRGIDPLTNRVQIYVRPTNIFNLSFFVKVVGVLDIFTRRDDDDLSALLSGLLLSGGSQGIGLDNPLVAVLLIQALSGDRDQDDILPLLIAMSGQQQNNILPLPLLLLLLTSRLRGPAILREIEERGEERGEEREEEEARGRWAEVEELRLEVAAERARRLQAEESFTATLARIEESFAALLARITEGQAGPGEPATETQARRARRTPAGTTEHT
jgi:hypothetical protein